MKIVSKSMSWQNDKGHGVTIVISKKEVYFETWYEGYKNYTFLFCDDGRLPLQEDLEKCLNTINFFHSDSYDFLPKLQSIIHQSECFYGC